MSQKGKMNVVLCWHMHQPEYRNALTGEYQQPWTYLHAIKDYVDMAAHLEAVPKAKAVFNFTPTLLEQLQDYSQQLFHFLYNNGPIHDPLLAALANPVLPSDCNLRRALIMQCGRANAKRLIDPFPHFKRLINISKWLESQPRDRCYLNDQYLIDLLVWYHLVWLGATVRRYHPVAQHLMQKEREYSLQDRRQLLKLIYELIKDLIPRYRKLLENRQIELSTTPYAHPIMPLLLDMHSIHEAMPNAPLPEQSHYPQGEERVHWHLNKGQQVFEQCFGQKATGCWPSEGSLSRATLPLLSQHGFKWTASGESVLRNSLNHSKTGDQTIHKPYRVTDEAITCFFRDDRLSDAIGFDFVDWHADDAVANLIQNLERIAHNTDNPEDKVVSIILDGENAWEYYPENGYYFLSALYQRLVENPLLHLTTFSDCLQGCPTGELTTLIAGSWVYGSFSTWIGDKDKNRAWDMLVDAKKVFDAHIDSLTAEQAEQARIQLAICEGSDWCWWFGDYNPSASVNDFDRLYRLQLSALYKILHAEPPEYLSHAFSHGGQQHDNHNPSAGGAMRKGS
jgi:alpha-amylase/alpha-mannosidase (GH57 family)